jgi:hypothetical protein
MEARLMRPRIEQELALLRQYYADIEHLEASGEDWFKIPRYPFPPGWRIGNDPIVTAPVVFKVTAAHPGAEPYAFLTPAGINFNGMSPNSAGPSNTPPFTGSWHQFSWSPDSTWAPTNDVHRGSNLLVWVRSFLQRLKEGA